MTTQDKTILGLVKSCILDYSDEIRLFWNKERTLEQYRELVSNQEALEWFFLMYEQDPKAEATRLALDRCIKKDLIQVTPAHLVLTVYRRCKGIKPKARHILLMPDLSTRDIFN